MTARDFYVNRITRFPAPVCILAIAAGLLAAACTPRRSLVVALHPWVGYESLYLARDLKWLPESIRLRESNTLGESLDALKSREVDAACMTLDEMLRARADGIPLSAALVLDISAGADTVLARPEIANLSQLAHRRIGFDHNALGALVFEKLLEDANLPASAVIQIDLPPARQLEAWRRREVDVVITYEPLTTVFLREGARNLYDSRQMPDTIIDVLAVRNQTGTLPLVQDLVVAHFRALAHMHTNEQDALLRISAREDLSPDEARRMLAGVNLPSLAANRYYLGGDNPQLLRAARSLSSLMVRRGLLKQEDDLKHLILPGTLPDEIR